MYKISSSYPDQLQTAVSQQPNRNRGVILSPQGWQKLTQAGVLYDQGGNRYTYETLSERSLLHERTVSRILSCEVRVDKRSLKIFFAAFGLQLCGDDYMTTISNPVDRTIDSFSHYLNSTVHSVETALSYQELVELHQRLKQDLSHLSYLLHLHEINKSISLQ